METIDSIKTRWSNYKYKNKDIPKDVIEDILNCGRLAPSAKNRQPWYFVVTTGNTKNEITNIMLSEVGRITDKDEIKRIGHPCSLLSTARTIKKVPVLILIFRPNDKAWAKGDRLSLGACIENMCLRATELGIGSLWILDTVYVEKEIQKVTNHEDMELVCGLLLGYPDQKPRKKIRKKLKDMMEWQI